MKLVKILVLASLVISQFAFADDYKTAQRFKNGDVISADVLNDILDRVELALRPFSTADLTGKWEATQVYCSDGEYEGSGGLTMCLRDKTMAGSSIVGGIYPERTDTITIAADSNGTMSWVSTNYNFLYNANTMGDISDTEHFNSSKTHECRIVAKQMLSCLLDASLTYTAGPSQRRIVVFMHLQRSSPTQIKLSYGPENGGYNFNYITMDKINLSPVAPTSLELAAQSGSIALSWTAGDATATGYDIQRKTTFDGTYASIGTGAGTDISFTDSSVTVGTTYWYRVFATNANGTTGSNVVKLTYVEATE